MLICESMPKCKGLKNAILNQMYLPGDFAGRVSTLCLGRSSNIFLRFSTQSFQFCTIPATENSQIKNLAVNFYYFRDLFMLAGANMQYAFQNGVLPDVMTPLAILLENVHTDGVFPSENLTTTRVRL